MSFFSKLRGTFETIFQIGKAGPNLKANGAAIEARNFADSAFVVSRALDPVAANDLVTLSYFNANNAAANGLTYAKVVVGTATVVSTTAIPNNYIIMDCRIDVTTAYDATTTITVARTGGGASLAAASDSDPTVAPNVYQIPQDTSWGSTGAGTITVTVSGTPAAGASIIYIGYVLPTNFT